jgi:hypothetical protein
LSFIEALALIRALTVFLEQNEGDAVSAEAEELRERAANILRNSAEITGGDHHASTSTE